jgi:aminoglycoside phosphotransferase (APT) family kinase protein
MLRHLPLIGAWLPRDKLKGWVSNLRKQRERDRQRDDDWAELAERTASKWDERAAEGVVQHGQQGKTTT